MSWIASNWPALLSAQQVTIHAISAVAGAGLQNQVSIAPVAGHTLYLRRFQVTSFPVAAVVAGVVQVTGLNTDDGNPLNFDFTETVSAGGWLDQTFDEPLQASAPNSAITVTLPAIAGGAVSTVTLIGWSL